MMSLKLRLSHASHRRSSGSRVSTYCRRRAAWINALLLWPIEMSRDVFISYRSEDRATAERICAGLERENISCWIAPRDIPPGGDWPSLIFEAIRSAKVFLIVLSSNSKNDAKQISREAALADKQRLNFIVFRVEIVEPPEALSFFLVNVQYLDGFGDQFDSAVARLVDQVRELKKGPWDKLGADLEKLEQALHSLGSLLVIRTHGSIRTCFTWLRSRPSQSATPGKLFRSSATRARATSLTKYAQRLE